MSPPTLVAVSTATTAATVATAATAAAGVSVATAAIAAAAATAASTPGSFACTLPAAPAAVTTTTTAPATTDKSRSSFDHSPVAMDAFFPYPNPTGDLCSEVMVMSACVLHSMLIILEPPPGQSCIRGSWACA